MLSFAKGQALELPCVGVHGNLLVVWALSLELSIAMNLNLNENDVHLPGMTNRKTLRGPVPEYTLD